MTVQHEQRIAMQKGLEDQELYSHARQALIGYGWMDLFGSVRLHFGTWNNRPINKAEVKKLLESFKQNGIQNSKPAHVIPLIVPRSFFEAHTVTRDPDASLDAPIIEWTAEASMNGVKAAGGRHRYMALQDWKQALEKSMKGKKRANQETEAEVDEKAKPLGWWMVALFDEGKRYLGMSDD